MARRGDGSRATTTLAWPEALSVGREISSGRLGEAPLDALPALIDSVYASLVRKSIAAIPSTVASEDARLSYVIGRQAVVSANHADARRWFARAQGLLTSNSDTHLVQRLAFELGCIHLQDGSIAGAETVVAWAEGLTAPRQAGPDILHLRALIAELRGDRRRAIALYRRAISRSHLSLTPLSHVLLLRNLASSLAHERPHETVTLYRRAIELIHAQKLEAGSEPGLRNGLGYALICGGDLASAHIELRTAYQLAGSADRPAIGLFARFNKAIIDELEGRMPKADADLELVRVDSESTDLAALANWCRLRRTWVLLKEGRRNEARSTLAQARAHVVSQQADTIRTLDALFALIDGRALLASSELRELASAYRARGDLITAFVLWLWKAVADLDTGSRKSAEEAVREACALRHVGALSLSPSWWAREVVDVAADLGQTEACSDALWRVEAEIGGPDRPSVVAEGDRIWVDSHELSPEQWRKRTGAHVLRKFFGLLLRAHPDGLGQEELADLLWPDSEGDRAMRNLYGATKDLRRVLSVVPGLRVRLSGRRLSLDPARNVTLRAPQERLGD